jgi:hypothetical protein
MATPGAELSPHVLDSRAAVGVPGAARRAEFIRGAARSVAVRGRRITRGNVSPHCAALFASTGFDDTVEFREAGVAAAAATAR